MQTDSPAAVPVVTAAPQTPAPVTDSTTPPVEGTAAPAAPKQDKQGVALAKLAHQQKAAREAAEKLKAERLAFESDRKAHEAQQTEYRAYQEAREQAKRFPLKYLESLGLTVQDVTEAALNDGQPTPNLEVKAVRDELEQFKRQQEEAKRQALDEQRQALQAQEQQVLENFQHQVTEHLKAAGEKYELTNHFGHHGLVVQVIEEHAAAQQAKGVPFDQIKLLSIEEAAEAVEQQLEAEAKKISALKKFSAPKADPPSATPAQKTKEQPPRSITNQLSPSTQAQRPKPLTMAERERLAAEILRKGRGQ